MEAVTHHLYMPDCTPRCPGYQQMQAYRDEQKENSEMLKVVAIWLVGLEFLFFMLFRISFHQFEKTRKEVSLCQLF